jgi:hypothetical protein
MSDKFEDDVLIDMYVEELSMEEMIKESKKRFLIISVLAIIVLQSLVVITVLV